MTDLGQRAFELYNVLCKAGMNAELKLWSSSGTQHFVLSTTPLYHGLPARRKKPCRRQAKKTPDPTAVDTPLFTSKVEAGFDAAGTSSRSASGTSSCGGNASMVSPRILILLTV